MGGDIESGVDRVLDRLSGYAAGLEYGALSPSAIHAAKVRIIDTLGALIAGFDGEPCAIARRMAASAARSDGATLLGTDMVVAPDMAAFVNATTSRYAEANDVYRWPNASGGHPSDVIMPVLAVAESVKADGREFIQAVVLAYEVFCRISDCMVGWGKGVEPTNFARIAVAAAAARLWRLPPDKITHAISMSAIAGNLVRQVRTGHLSVWKSVASGEAGRAGVFAALLAQEGMEGPRMPFEGKNGWCAQVAQKSMELDQMGGAGVPFKIEVTLIKPRSVCAATISSVLAAEPLSQRLLGRITDIRQVEVAVYGSAKEGMGTGEHHWNPQSRETADHSIPYVVAATLLDGTAGPAQFDAAHIADPALKALLAKIAVAEDESFTTLYKKHPAEHHARITVHMDNGEKLVAESGGAKGDLANPNTDGQIGEKFHDLTDGALGAHRAKEILERLWNMDRMKSVAGIPPDFVVEPKRHERQER
jgi:2-methylcitrate dehydratase